jgi:hypothetical protein
MSFTLQMIFEGVAAFVPDIPLNFSRPAAVTYVDAYFPNLEEPHDAGLDLKDATIRRPHILTISVDPDHLARGTDRIAAAFHRFERAAEEQAVFVVEKAGPLELNLEVVKNGLEIVQVKPEDPDDVTKSSSALERSSMWWVAHRQRLSSQAYHDVYLKNSGNQASVSITGGRMYVSQFSNGGKPWLLKRVYSPRDPRESVDSQVLSIANQVKVDVDVHKAVLVGPVGARDRTIVIEGPEGSTVPLVFRNAEPEFLLGSEFSVEGPDPDFAELYRRSAGSSFYPWVLPFFDSDTGSTLKPCAPGLYTAAI